MITVDGLVNAIALALSVWNAAQRCRGQQTQRARDNTGFVGDDVAKQVAGNDDAVEGSGVLDHDHGSRVDQLVAELELGELLLHNLRHDLPPQSRGGENIGLVQRPDRCWWVLGKSQVCGEAGNSLDLVA